MEGSRKRGERDRAGLRLTAKAASSGTLQHGIYLESCCGSLGQKSLVSAWE